MSSRFSYLTDDWQLNRAMNDLDNELSDLKARIEDVGAYQDQEFQDLKRRVSRIEKFLQKKFLEEWDSFEADK